MAPRRGGGGGGGYSSSENDSIWLEEVQVGLALSKDHAIAIAVFYGLFMTALLGTNIWASILKRKHKSTDVVTKVLGNNRWGLAVVFGLIYFAFAFSDAIIRVNDTYVKVFYLIIYVILLSTTFISDILLLFTIYVLLFQCFVSHIPLEDTKRRRRRTIFLIHGWWCAALTALYLAVLALQIRDTVEVPPLGSRRRRGRFYPDVPDSTKVLAAYCALFFASSVEVFLVTVRLVWNAGSRNLSRTLRSGLVGLVGFPFLFYGTLQLAYLVRTDLQQHRPKASAVLAAVFLGGFTFVMVFVGVVFVCQQFAKAARASWQGAQQNGPGPMLQPGGPMMSPQSPQPYGQQYGAPSPQFGVPPQHYGLPQQYGPPQQHYGAPPQQYAAPPHQYGAAPQQLSSGPKPYNMGSQQTNEVPPSHN